MCGFLVVILQFFHLYFVLVVFDIVVIVDLGLAPSELGSIIRGALMILRGRCKPESDAAMNDSWRVMPFRDQAFASSLFGNSATE